ncbi:unnamed protein product [Cylindrotheca closterium]|uniref:MORN repeat-containing protein 5 n=1 Tax=Cylindrotheca closterium TaxID=2856 RepID=A0AAD2CBW2_9STRA|nr:unnamed protein product [Cylindrotheca closterium]
MSTVMLFTMMPHQEAPERTNTATRSQEEELQQIEADLQEEKIHSLRNRLDAMLGSLVQQQPSAPSGTSVASTITTASTTSSTKRTTAIPQKSPPADQTLLAGRIWVTDPYGDQGQYEGDVDTNNIPHGIGDMIYLDGRTYQGGWRHGHWDGPAKATFQNGDHFKGHYKMDQRHGPGKYQWKDGRSYVGDFHQDQRHGKGEFRWPDKSCYVGDFYKGHRHGYGNYKFPDGSVYEGTWKKSQMHGQGECKWADQRIYSGEWKSGKAHGLGKETRPDGSVRHDGLWEEDKPMRDIPSEIGISTNGTAGAPLPPPPPPPPPARAESLMMRVNTDDLSFLEQAAAAMADEADAGDSSVAETTDQVVGV